MIKFQNVIARADVDFYEEILGKSQIRLLNLMSGDFSKIETLRKLVYELYSPEILLSIKKYRISFVEYLKVDEAKTLCKILKLKVNNNDYFSPLKSFNPRFGSEKDFLFYDYFDLTPPAIESKDINVVSKTINPSYSLFNHQNDVCKEVNDILNSELPKCILHMPTGSGKTRTAMNLICEHFRKNNSIVVWLAYSNELCDQALDEFSKAWQSLGNRNIETHKLWGGFDLDLNLVNSGFIVAGFDKLYNVFKKDHNQILKLGRDTSLLVIDEAHQSIAPTYETVINLLSTNINTKILGLTATPGRTSYDIDEDLKLSKFFSMKKVSLKIKNYNNPVEYLIDEGYLARTEFKPLYYEGGIILSEKDVKAINSSLDIPQDILYRISVNEQRNLKIIFEVEKLLKKGHKRIILFGTTVQHAKDISSILSIRSIKSKCVTGNTDQLIRDRILTDYKNDSQEPFVLCNYGVLTTGFDAPKTSAAIIARPTKSLVLFSQMVGRAIRGIKAGGNKTADIITTVDINLPGFNSVEEAFTNWEDVYK